MQEGNQAEGCVQYPTTLNSYFLWFIDKFRIVGLQALYTKLLTKNKHLYMSDEKLSLIDLMVIFNLIDNNIYFMLK